MKTWIRTKLRNWLGVETNSSMIGTIEDLILFGDARRNGFAALKPHLQSKESCDLWKGKPVRYYKEQPDGKEAMFVSEEYND